MRGRIVAALLLICLTLTGCAAKGEDRFVPLTQKEAVKMADRDDVTVVDIRIVSQYSAGHIPGAVCLPDELLETSAGEMLPDLGKTLLVCSGSAEKSRKACGKLAEMGYLSVYAFGGMDQWIGELVTD